MRNLDREAGRAIDLRRRALAEAVVARQYGLRPELLQRYGEPGRAKCVQDTEYHLAFLSAALWASSPVLFADYAAWARAVLAAYEVRPEDVEVNLKCLGDVVGEALPDELAPRARACVGAGLQQPAAAQPDVPTFLAADAPLARQYLDALLRRDRQAACGLVLKAVQGGTPVQDIYLHVLQPCLREVGRLWQLNRLSVAQEHYCSASTQVVMSQLYPRVFGGRKTGPRLLAACVGGELHEIGLRTVADIFELEGWDTVYLGANTPAADLPQAVADYTPDVLALSVMMAYHLPAAGDMIAAVRSCEPGRRVKILVGGRPFLLDPALWQRVGADGSAADAREALAAAARLLGSGPAEGSGSGGRTKGPAPAAGISAPALSSPGEAGPLYDELSRVNNELLTLQRRLAKQNAELERLSEENRQRAERLAEADRRKDEFLAMLGHELRNPLGPIRNAVQVLHLKGGAEPILRQARDMIDRQAAHMARLLDDLLDVSRVARGKVLLRKETLDLARLVRATAEDYRSSLEANGLALTLELPAGPAWVTGDPTRLAQVVSNLLHNAAKFTDPGGHVSVRLAPEAEPGAVVLTIRDTGIGMEREVLGRVFEAFSQVERDRERSRSGLGLGLALVKALVELHGGGVSARSEGPGRGSEFTVRLPLARAGPEAGPAAAARPAARAFRILVVEDNRDAAESMKLLLEVTGHQVEVAHNGPAGVTAALRFRPQVVLCDIGLPGGMDGYAVARALRREPVLGPAYLVALTGYGREEDLRLAREAGFDLHLTKPVDFNELQQALASLPDR